MITFSGINILGGHWSFVDIIQPNTDINQFTFSNLDGVSDQIYALSIKWINPLTGPVQLEILPNEVSIPSGSGGVREQYCIDTATREDSALSILEIANLEAGTANTYVQGSMYFMVEENGFARFYHTDTFSYDANTTLGDRKRVTRCTGFYNDISTNITSLKFQINDARNAIGAGSDFRLFKVI